MMSQGDKEYTTIAKAERTCTCSDCLLDDIIEELEEGGDKP
jgi:hypothetical protein